jgi:hypothetical protein
MMMMTTTMITRALFLFLMLLSVLSSRTEQVVEVLADNTGNGGATCSSSSPLAADEVRPLPAVAVGLPATLMPRMVEYCDEMGILDLFESFFHHSDSGIEMAVQTELAVRGYHWWMERPSEVLHKMCPENEIAYHEFLAALKEGGLDEILARVGNHLGWESLTIYQASINGFWKDMHGNETRTLSQTRSDDETNKALELIIPILLPDNGVEVRIQSSDGDVLIHKYEINTAVMVKDGAYTQSVKDGDEDMLLAVSLVIGEITSTNMESILRDLNQTRFPNKDYLFKTVHWNRTNASVVLPEPVKRSGDFVFVENLQPGQIEPIRWAGNPTEIVSDNAFEVGMPPELKPTLLKYCREMGITSAFEDLVIHGKPLPSGNDVAIRLKNHLNWYVQRPAKHWNSNMHWISPFDKESQDDYLKILSKAGFDKVLKGIGERFDLEGLVAYHITFIGVSRCDEGYDHYDFTGTGDRAYNVIIPLILAANSSIPELDFSSVDHVMGSYKYRHGAASMVGDDCYHATAAVEYHNEMRMAATVYVADIQPSNIKNLMTDYTQKYPPKGDFNFLLSLAGTHWKRDDPTVKLPSYDDDDKLSR